MIDGRCSLAMRRSVAVRAVRCELVSGGEFPVLTRFTRNLKYSPASRLRPSDGFLRGFPAAEDPMWGTAPAVYGFVQVRDRSDDKQLRFVSSSSLNTRSHLRDDGVDQA